MGDHGCEEISEEGSDLREDDAEARGRRGLHRGGARRDAGARAGIEGRPLASAPTLTPRLWYGMPAYAKNGNVLCFFQDAKKFKSRYATLGFSDKAALDDGELWPTSFAVKALSAATESKITALVKRAVR